MSWFTFFFNYSFVIPFYVQFREFHRTTPRSAPRNPLCSNWSRFCWTVTYLIGYWRSEQQHLSVYLCRFKSSTFEGRIRPSKAELFSSVSVLFKLQALAPSKDLWYCLHVASAETLSELLQSPSKTVVGSFSSNDGNGNDNATNEEFDCSRDYKGATRAARTSEQVRAILSKTTTWNYLIYSFDDNLSINPQISNSLYLI